MPFAGPPLTQGEPACRVSQVGALSALASLHLSFFTWSWPVEAIRYAASLTRLEIECCSFDARWLKALSELRHLQATDTCFTFDDVAVRDAAVAAFYAAVASLRQLTYLALFGNVSLVPAATLLLLGNLKYFAAGSLIDERRDTCALPLMPRLESLFCSSDLYLISRLALPALRQLRLDLSWTIEHASSLKQQHHVQAVFASISRQTPALQLLEISSDALSLPLFVCQGLVELQKDCPKLCIKIVDGDTSCMVPQ